MRHAGPRGRLGGFLLVGLLAASSSVRADTASRVYDAMGLEPGDVLSGTVVTSRVVPGPAKQVVGVTTYFTGRKDRARGVNVRLDVFRQEGDKLSVLYSRDFGEENEGNVGRGELQLADLDGDDVNEIIVSFDDAEDPLIALRNGEVIVHEGGAFRTAWAGPLRYDASRAARSVPPERRDRFVREVDIPNTRRTRGVTLFMTKKVIVLAGQRLPEPREVQETFPMRSSPR